MNDKASLCFTLSGILSAFAIGVMFGPVFSDLVCLILLTGAAIVSGWLIFRGIESLEDLPK